MSRHEIVHVNRARKFGRRSAMPAGVAPNKFLSKIASGGWQPDGRTEIRAKDVEDSRAFADVRRVLL